MTLIVPTQIPIQNKDIFIFIYYTHLGAVLKIFVPKQIYT